MGLKSVDLKSVGLKSVDTVQLAPRSSQQVAGQMWHLEREAAAVPLTMEARSAIRNRLPVAQTVTAYLVGSSHPPQPLWSVLMKGARGILGLWLLLPVAATAIQGQTRPLPERWPRRWDHRH